MVKPSSSEQNQPAPHNDRSALIVWGALVSLALAMLLASLGVSIANVALPTIAQAFEASFQEVQWVLISYLLAITVLIVSVGRLGDVIGHRRVLIGGIVLFTVASVLCGIASMLWMLIAARAVQGIGAAVLMAIAVAFVRDAVPKEKTGRAMGLLGSMSAIGTALGPTLGGALIVEASWHGVFLVLVPLGILNLLLAYRYLPPQSHRPRADHSPFDIPGTVLLGFSLAAYALAMTAGRHDPGQHAFIVLLVAACAGFCLFVFVESRMASPLIQLALFRNRKLRASLAMNGLVSTIIMTTLVVGPFYLSLALGLDAMTVGFVMSVGPVVSALSGVPAGGIVDRFSAPVVVMVGLATMAAGSFALSIMPNLYGAAGYIAAMLLLTPGYALFQAANNTAVMMDASTDQRGVISGILGLSRNLGLITGAAVMGTIFAAATTSGDITLASREAVAAGMQTTFSVAAGLGVLAFVIAVSGFAFRERSE